MHPPVGSPAAAPLLDDDSPLRIDLLRLVEHKGRIIMHDEDAGVDYGRTDQRNVVEHICCLLDSRGGVDIASEAGSDALEPVKDALVRKILGSVEAHVLQEVGQPVLVRGLLDGSYVGSEVEFSPSGRLIIVADVVGKPVVELSLLHLRVVRKFHVLPEGETAG